MHCHAIREVSWCVVLVLMVVSTSERFGDGPHDSTTSVQFDIVNARGILCAGSLQGCPP